MDGYQYGQDLKSMMIGLVVVGVIVGSIGIAIVKFLAEHLRIGWS